MVQDNPYLDSCHTAEYCTVAWKVMTLKRNFYKHLYAYASRQAMPMPMPMAMPMAMAVSQNLAKPYKLFSFSQIGQS